MTQKRKPRTKAPKLEVQPDVVVPAEPEVVPIMTLDQIISDLKGFGIEDIQEPIIIRSKGQVVQMKLSNIPTEDELMTLLATEEYKGHAWIARVKGEILSHSISWLNGTNLRDKKDSIVIDPTSGEEVIFHVALRNMLMGWGQEVINVLWKILMVHCQQLEDRLFESLPDSQVMTDVEKRFISQAMQEIEAAQREVYRDAAQSIMGSEAE